MITKIGEKDGFGYDDNGKPVAAQIGPNTIVFGYPFCSRLREAISVGFEVIHAHYIESTTIIAIYSPQARVAEIWFGRWMEVDPSQYHVVDPGYQGLTVAEFDSVTTVMDYIKSNDPKPMQPGYLQTAGDPSELVRPDVTADTRLSWRLKKPTIRYPNCQIIVTLLADSESKYADDIQYLIKNLFEYVYRVRAAVELNQYAETMHFSTPATIPPSAEKFSLLIEWKQIAARDAAFSVFHFQKSFENFREVILWKCPTLRKTIDIDKLRFTWRLHQSWFKDAVHTRHAIGHSAEFYMTVRDRARHATHEDVFIESTMLNDVLSLSSFGKFVSIEVSDKTVEKLERIRTLILESFSAVLETH